MDGLWSSPDLPAWPSSPRSTARRWRWAAAGGDPVQLRRTIAHRARRNTIAGSRRNIAAHYDLGNDFYRLFLDETLTYSSAVFESPDQSLADAQRNKYRRMAERAGLRRPARPRDRHRLGRLRAVRGRRARLPGHDRHHLEGPARAGHASDPRSRPRGSGRRRAARLSRDRGDQYDAIVSIEMLEAVGAEYFEAFFEACDRALEPGRPAEPADDRLPGRRLRPQVRGANWIQTYIFPGGLLPSLAAIERSLHGTTLLIRGVDDIAQHYVRTLATWRAAFLAAWTRCGRWASTSASSGCGTTTAMWSGPVRAVDRVGPTTCGGSRRRRNHRRNRRCRRPRSPSAPPRRRSRHCRDSPRKSVAAAETVDQVVAREPQDGVRIRSADELVGIGRAPRWCRERTRGKRGVARRTAAPTSGGADDGLRNSSAWELLLAIDEACRFGLTLPGSLAVGPGRPVACNACPACGA